ncbi:MAG: ATP-binding protein [Thermodesulfobacteriota bacterium]
MPTSLRGKLIVIFLILTVSGVIISGGFARFKQQNYALERVKEQAAVSTAAIEDDILSLFNWVFRDLLMMRDAPLLHSYLNWGSEKDSPELLEAIAKEFMSIAVHHEIFQQIRLIREDGMEVVRVNTNGRNAWITKTEALQNKKRRYYFQAAMKLAPGEVYLSPLDLNVEHGEVERPLLPVIRCATAVFDHWGNRKGILVLNVYGKSFLNVIASQQQKVLHGERYYLLDENGYFLHHPDEEKTFGFMFERSDTLDRYEPEVNDWIGGGSDNIQVIPSLETGRDTLFAYRKIKLPTTLDVSSGTGQGKAEHDNHWILLFATDDVGMLVGFDEYVRSFMPFFVTLLAICVIVAILVAWSCSRPVISLAEAAKKIQEGNLSARAEVYSADDMGQFGNLFNEMAAKLQQTINRLTLSENKYRQIFENSKDCIFVTDMDCRILDINDAGRDLFGVGDDSGGAELFLPGCRRPDIIYHEEQRALVGQVIEQSGFVRDYEVSLMRPDGTVRLCLLTATSRYDDKEELIGYEGILRDITDKRKRQEEERSFRRRLQDEIVLAEDRERRHIGQILHEEMAQNLALANIKIQEAENLCGQGSPEKGNGAAVEEHLAQTRDLLGVMIGQIRTMIFDLYPTVLEKQGLLAAMHWYAEHFSRQTGIEVTVYGGEDSFDLKESQRIYLYRAYKELLNNAWKHAETKEVVSTVKKRENHFRLTVDDEGKGFDPKKLSRFSHELKGIGLVAIDQWVEAMDGVLDIESEPGNGTRVVIDIPLAGAGGGNK